eukprot:g299.t1
MHRSLLQPALLLAAAALVASSPPAWHELDGYSFEAYARDFHKQYDNAVELARRERIFNRELLKIQHHNAQAGISFRMGVNQFTDLEADEMKARLGFDKALARDYRARNPGLFKPLPLPNASAMRALPDSVDWREKQIVTAVKDQGHCGSCWAFASTETLETYVAIATKQLMVLSPQQLVSCSPNPNHCGGTGGCRGSIPELAFDYVKKAGMATEWTYPYESGVSGETPKGCKMADNSTKSGATPPPALITVGGFQKLEPNSYDAVLHALATVGPLAINVQANTWRNYETGVYDGCTNLTAVDIDHVVQLVGYGTDAQHGDYWLVRNSWNTGFGESGYIRLRRSATPVCGTDPTPEDGTGCAGAAPQHVCGQCGLLFDASYPTGAKLR